MASKRGKQCRRLTMEKKAAIIKLVKSGRSQADVSKEFGISKQTVFDFLRNKDKMLEAAEKPPGAQKMNASQGLPDMSVDGCQPTADVHVVKPSYLRLSVSPGAWVLERQASYWVEVQLFDDQQHRIHASEGLQVDVHFPPEYFEVNYSTENGTAHWVRTLQNGSTMIRVELLGCRQPDGSLLPASAVEEQSVSIQERLTVQPEEVWLPWEPEKQPAYMVEVHAYGGTGAPRTVAAGPGRTGVGCSRRPHSRSVGHRGNAQRSRTCAPGGH
ncbi:hypothetical protein MRX96_012695 [Rhipicephalus microplus]